jgi:hypothetical protein
MIRGLAAVLPSGQGILPASPRRRAQVVACVPHVFSQSRRRVAQNPAVIVDFTNPPLSIPPRNG